MNSTKVISARDSYYQEYSFGTTTVSTRRMNESNKKKESNWMEKIEASNQNKDERWKREGEKVIHSHGNRIT